MIDKIVLLTGTTTKHEIIQQYIDLAIKDFEFLTKRSYNEKYESIIVQMVIEKYNKRYNEGVASTAIGTGLTTTFINGYSQDIKDQLRTLKVNARVF